MGLNVGWKARLVSMGVWIINLLVFLPFSLLLTALAWWVPADRLEWLTRTYVRLQLATLGIRWSAIVDPSIDPAQPYLFIQNHVNHFDFIYAYRATPHYKQGIELASHFRYPFYGWLMKARGTIGVIRGSKNPLANLLAKARLEVAAGHSLLMFPEGTRTLTGHIGPFKRGAFQLAHALGLPIVPVVVVGAFAILRKGSLVIRPGREVKVHLLAPIPTAGLDEPACEALRHRLRAEMETVLENAATTR